MLSSDISSPKMNQETDDGHSFFVSLSLRSPKIIHQICRLLDLASLQSVKRACKTTYKTVQKSPSECVSHLSYVFPNPWMKRHYLQLESSNNVFANFTTIEDLTIHFRKPDCLNRIVSEEKGEEPSLTESQMDRPRKKGDGYQLMEDEVTTEEKSMTEQKEKNDKGKNKKEMSLFCQSIMNQWSEKFKSVRRLEIIFTDANFNCDVLCTVLSPILRRVGHLSLFRLRQYRKSHEMTHRDLDRLYFPGGYNYVYIFFFEKWAEIDCTIYLYVHIYMHMHICMYMYIYVQHNKIKGATILKQCVNVESLTTNYPFSGDYYPVMRSSEKLRQVYRLQLNECACYNPQQSVHAQNIVAITPTITVVSTVKLQLSLLKFFSPQMTSLHLHGSRGLQRMDLLWSSFELGIDFDRKKITTKYICIY
ncbi:hypothetical protein RFI_07350, partial [Reticulomyxa filosa]